MPPLSRRPFPLSTYQNCSSGTCTWSGKGQCSLAFTADGQPAGTAAGAVMAAGFGSKGGPVKVKVLDGSGHLVTGSTAAVTIAIGSNPGSGSLSGTLTVHAKGGIASFSNLSIDKPGIGYTLTARSPGITRATSARFTIWGSLRHCSTKPCSASSSSATTAGTVTTSSADPAEFLGVGQAGRGAAHAAVGAVRRLAPDRQVPRQGLGSSRRCKLADLLRLHITVHSA